LAGLNKPTTNADGTGLRVPREFAEGFECLMPGNEWLKRVVGWLTLGNGRLAFGRGWSAGVVEKSTFGNGWSVRVVRRLTFVFDRVTSSQRSSTTSHEWSISARRLLLPSRRRLIKHCGSLT
jgi:hypothetical protein